MTQELLNELKNLNKKIDTLVRLNLYEKIQSKNRMEQIEILSNMKFKNFEIAQILETTQNNVDVTLNKIRKNKKNDK